MARPVNINAIAYFEAVARHSRVNLAAEELMVSPSAVSQQVKSLEKQLGVLLFRRVKRRLILTEEGERYYVSASAALNLLREAQERASRRPEHRKLVIRVSPSFGVRWLGPRLSGFLLEYPWLDLHVDATSELTDFDKENVDLEIRYGPYPPPGLHSQPLIADRVLPLCVPKFAEQANMEAPVVALQSMRLIHTVKAFVTWNEWLKRQGVGPIDTDRGVKFDRSSMSLQSAEAGVGPVLETATLAMKEIRTGTLVPMVPAAGTLRFDAYWVVCPPRHLNRRAVKAFVTWIEAEAKTHDVEVERLLSSIGAGAEQIYFD